MKLQPLRFIKQFTVDHAHYRIGNSNGGNVELSVDYAGNTFAVESDSTDEKFLEEVRQVARGLLARKHAVNLAEKDHYLITLE